MGYNTRNHSRMRIFLNFSTLYVGIIDFFQLLFGGLNQSPNVSIYEARLNQYFFIAEICSLLSIGIFLLVFNSNLFKQKLYVTKYRIALIIPMLIICATSTPYHFALLKRDPTNIAAYFLLFYNTYVLYITLKVIIQGCPRQ